ncbi:GNAT family N-acetyltransferase [Brachybacterium sp. NBEC-018]|uniref:GNAT family N-acetyltransferase n=1 Tax=Brachybacterium sp. NBEC-018 TaxID=2996004 RepID=UPI00217566A6|nr:GNAT family N-acetyltransferase [Brachybacterium sp. NBEC-018]UVY82964.1 GNAT family N-acetyltransferase [Brachybacterium sp. NBEC-018]
MATVDPGPTTIRPLSVESWGLFDALVERHGGIFGGCWCTYFHPDDGERAPGAEGNREFKRRLVEEGVAHAALVIREDADGEEAVAWAEYGTPGQLPGLHHRQQYFADLENAGESEPDYRVTCIFVDRRFRRHGLVTRALDGALALIAQDGGGVVEGYPHVPREKKVSASFLYNGTQSVYERAGFEFVRSKGRFNTVMRRVVAPV